MRTEKVIRLTMDDIEREIIYSSVFDWNWEDDTKADIHSYHFTDKQGNPFYVEVKLSNDADIKISADVKIGEFYNIVPILTRFGISISLDRDYVYILTSIEDIGSDSIKLLQCLIILDGLQM